MPTKKKVKKARIGTKKEFGLMMVRQVMQKQVQAAHLKTKGDVIASLMIEGFGAVPVVDAEDRLLGIVSEHDLLGALDDGKKLGAVTASDIMTFNPLSSNSKCNTTGPDGLRCCHVNKILSTHECGRP